MFLPVAALFFLSIPAWAIDVLEEDFINTDVATTINRAPNNKTFDNVRVYQTLQTRDFYVENDAVVGGTLQVNGVIAGGGIIHGPTTSTLNAVARFADASGTQLNNSSVIIDNAGNMTGINNLTATQVNAYLNGTASAAASVGGQSATNVAAATALALSATCDDIPNTIVRRDAQGSFISTMITLTGVVTIPQNAATKGYVDATAGPGFITLAPVLAMSTTNTGIAGLYTLDGIALSAGNRVLLTGQTNHIQNGLWLAAVGPWSRPPDFFTGNPALQSYALVTNGTTYAGSGWICTTPSATIDSNALAFVQFSSPGNVTGANAGSGAGTLFKNKTGNLINLKTLVAGPHMVIANNSNDITLATDATSGDIPNTLVVRDSLGNFSATTVTARLTGTASENILRSGDSMTGTFTVIAGSPANPALQFAGSTHTGFSASQPNTLSFDTNGVERMSINATGTVTITQFTSPGIIHNNATGQLLSSLIVNADIAANAQIADTKLATISTPGKVLNSATSATSLNLPNTIIQRDSTGNFAANIITAVSITATSTENVLRAGDSMIGTFTVIAGSAANPSLQFAGSTNTGFSAETSNRLSFDTNGVERMSIDGNGIVSIKNTLSLAPGSATQPSLQFSNGTNTGISSETPNKLSFDVNGIERMSIDASGIKTVGAAFVIDNVMSIQSTQFVNLVNPSGNNISINNGVSLLIISYTDNVTIDTLTMPSNPIEGQLVTIKAIRLTSGNLNIASYIPAFNPTSEGINQLSPFANLAGSQGGASVTYIWLTRASGVVSNGWYRYGRG